MSTTAIPAPRRAGLELPDQAAVDAAGINLPLAQAREVLCSISRHVCTGSSRRGTDPYTTTRLCLTAAELTFVAYDEQVGPLCAVDWKHAAPPAGETALSHLGVDRAVLTDYRDSCDYSDWCLPLEWALEFVPAAAWEALAAVIATPPDVLRPRLDELVRFLATSEPARKDYRRKPSRRTGKETLLGSGVDARVGALFRFLDCLVALRQELLLVREEIRPLSLERLAAWTHVPPRLRAKEVGAASPATSDFPAPAVPFERLAAAYELRIAELQGRPPAGSHLRQRNFLVQCLLPVMGERDYAFRNAMLEDIESEHCWPDGSVTPAITVYPGKTRDAEEPYTRPITSRAWELGMVPWLRMNGWQLDMKGQALFPGRDGKTPISTLDIGGQWHPQRRGVRRTLALIPFSGELVTGRLPVRVKELPPGRLHPRAEDYVITYDWGVETDEGGWPLTEPVNNPFRGYPAHSYRKTCHRAVGVVFRRLDRLGLIPEELEHVEAVHFKRAMTSHVLGRDVDDVYDGIDDLGEWLCAVIAQPLEDFLWTGKISAEDSGPPMGADLDAVRAARERRDASRSTVDALGESIRAKRLEKQELLLRKRTASSEIERQRLERVVDALSETIDRENEHRVLLLEELPDLAARLEAAKSDRCVVIADGVSADEWEREVAVAAGEATRAAIPAEALPQATGLNFRRSASFLNVSDSRVRQMYAETRAGKLPRKLRDVLRPGLAHEQIWDPSRRNYDRRLLASAVDWPQLGASEKQLLTTLLAEQAYDDGTWSLRDAA